MNLVFKIFSSSRNPIKKNTVKPKLKIVNPDIASITKHFNKNDKPSNIKIFIKIVAIHKKNTNKRKLLIFCFKKFFYQSFKGCLDRIY